MVDRLRLSRAQIAAFVGNDPEAIRQIEKLFSTAVSQETGIDEVAVIAGTADSKASQALSELQRIADALEMIALAPIGDVVVGDDFLTPPTPDTSLRSAPDVNIITPVDGQLLAYLAGRWINVGQLTADLTNNTGRLIDSSVNLTDGAGANVGTLTNSPVTGNPTKWVPIDDNGTTRYIPAW